MNTPKNVPFQLGLAMAAVVAWTSWGALGGAYQLRLLPRAAGFSGAAASPHQAEDEARAKFELSRRLGDIAEHPETIQDGDLRAMRRAFGSELADLLRLLRRGA